MLRRVFLAVVIAAALAAALPAGEKSAVTPAADETSPQAAATKEKGVPADEQKALLACLPADGFYGALKLEQPVKFYDQTNLYEYIDGQAEGFISYDFLALASATYAAGEDNVVVDVYDMQKPILAFGLYSTFRAPTNEFVEMGAQGFKTGEGYMFWKGRMVVKVSGNYADEAATYKAAEAAAKAADAKIADDRAGLALVTVLPEKGKTANSDKYYLEAVLGQSFLSNGAVGEYPFKGGVARLFVCEFGDEKAAAKAYGEYLKFATAHGTPVETEPGKSFRAEVKYYGATEVFTAGRYVAGGVSLPQEKSALIDGLREAVVAARAKQEAPGSRGESS
jgi:hypothetical protein